MKLREILVLQEEILAPRVDKAISAIDSLHRWPVLPQIPIVLSQAKLEQGAYHYLSRPNRSICVKISRYASYPAWTLLHEVGHVLDHLVLGSIKMGFASDIDPLFDEIAELWKQSSIVQNMRMLLSTKGKKESVGARLAMTEQLSARELWAKTYAQWVCTRANDDQLRSQFEKVRTEGHYFAGSRCLLQWDDHAFERIMQAVDDLLNQKELT